MEMFIAAGIFVIMYAVIIWEKFSRAVVTMLAAGVVIFLGILNQEAAVRGIDFNTIGLLIGMMIIVHICQKTGMFQYLAIKSAKAVRGEPWRILVILSVVTAILSALLDNVTTVLITVPITILIADELKLSRYPFLVSQIFASNIGGTATLIGDPPNIMIGSAVGLTFMDFVVNVGVIIPVILIATLIPLKMIYGKGMKVTEEQKLRIMAFREEEAIKDRNLLKKCMFVFGLVISGFILQRSLHLESATIALFGAALLMLISKEEFHETMNGVEWTMIFFFVGLFVIVTGMVEAGIIKLSADKLLAFTGGDMTMTTMVILWFSTIAACFTGGIPYVAAMIPLIKGMAVHMGGDTAIMPLWWALSLGACLGGNGTIIGAAANVVVAQISERSGEPIGFLKFLTLAFPLMLISIVISTIYLYLRYLL